jgi:hypothetical protein
MSGTTASAGGNGAGGATGGAGVGGQNGCAGPNESCANGQMCCGELTCCAGQPIPKGQEYCSATTCPKSDRNAKRDFREVNPDEVLEQLCKLPVSTWSYKTEDPSVRHMGAMAQDFKARFGLGSTDLSFYTVDAHGVAFASIQALAARLKKLEQANEDLRRDVGRLERELVKARAR